MKVECVNSNFFVSRILVMCHKNSKRLANRIDSPNGIRIFSADIIRFRIQNTQDHETWTMRAGSINGHIRRIQCI